MQRVIHRLRNIVSAWILAKSDEDRSTTTQPNDERNRTDGRTDEKKTNGRKIKGQKNKGKKDERKKKGRTKK